jgi:hypothetical protein
LSLIIDMRLMHDATQMNYKDAHVAGYRRGGENLAPFTAVSNCAAHLRW